MEPPCQKYLCHPLCLYPTGDVVGRAPGFYYPIIFLIFGGRGVSVRILVEIFIPLLTFQAESVSCYLVSFFGYLALHLAVRMPTSLRDLFGRLLQRTTLTEEQQDLIFGEILPGLPDHPGDTDDESAFYTWLTRTRPLLETIMIEIVRWAAAEMNLPQTSDSWIPPTLGTGGPLDVTPRVAGRPFRNGMRRVLRHLRVARQAAQARVLAQRDEWRVDLNTAQLRDRRRTRECAQALADTPPEMRRALVVLEDIQNDGRRYRARHYIQGGREFITWLD